MNRTLAVTLVTLLCTALAVALVRQFADLETATHRLVDDMERVAERPPESLSAYRFVLETEHMCKRLDSVDAQLREAETKIDRLLYEVER